ncbi:hypothetical protein SVAN01_07669 [Stagonosporopsis vannaccii]|nr:hypothetical protein SVAN01_07669 [Stagonosporopsis vannaccii]
MSMRYNVGLNGPSTHVGERLPIARAQLERTPRRPKEQCWCNARDTLGGNTIHKAPQRSQGSCFAMTRLCKHAIVTTNCTQQLGEAVSKPAGRRSAPCPHSQSCWRDRTRRKPRTRVRGGRTQESGLDCSSAARAASARLLWATMRARRCRKKLSTGAAWLNGGVAAMEGGVGGVGVIASSRAKYSIEDSNTRSGQNNNTRLTQCGREIAGRFRAAGGHGEKQKKKSVSRCLQGTNSDAEIRFRSSQVRTDAYRKSVWCRAREGRFGPRGARSGSGDLTRTLGRFGLPVRVALCLVRTCMQRWYARASTATRGLTINRVGAAICWAAPYAQGWRISSIFRQAAGHSDTVLHKQRCERHVGLVEMTGSHMSRAGEAPTAQRQARQAARSRQQRQRPVLAADVARLDMGVDCVRLVGRRAAQRWVHGVFKQLLIIPEPAPQAPEPSDSATRTIILYRPPGTPVVIDTHPSDPVLHRVNRLWPYLSPTRLTRDPADAARSFRPHRLSAARRSSRRPTAPITSTSPGSAPRNSHLGVLNR